MPEPFRALIAEASAAEDADPEAGEPVGTPSDEDTRRKTPSQVGLKRRDAYERQPSTVWQRPGTRPPTNGRGAGTLPTLPTLETPKTRWVLPRVVTDVHGRSSADGVSLRRPPLDEETLPQPSPRLWRPARARRVFRHALAEYEAGRVFSARTDALLAQVYDPENGVYRRAAERWGQELLRGGVSS